MADDFAVATQRQNDLVSCCKHKREENDSEIHRGEWPDVVVSLVLIIICKYLSNEARRQNVEAYTKDEQDDEAPTILICCDEHSGVGDYDQTEKDEVTSFSVACIQAICSGTAAREVVEWEESQDKGLAEAIEDFTCKDLVVEEQIT